MVDGNASQWEAAEYTTNGMEIIKVTNQFMSGREPEFVSLPSFE
jgi:hypothetical protein